MTEALDILAEGQPEARSIVLALTELLGDDVQGLLLHMRIKGEALEMTCAAAGGIRELVWLLQPHMEGFEFLADALKAYGDQARAAVMGELTKQEAPAELSQRGP